MNHYFRAFSFSTNELDMALVGIDDLAGEIQAQAKSLGIRVLHGAVKSLEQEMLPG
jgi:hypothetical protein